MGGSDPDFPLTHARPLAPRARLLRGGAPLHLRAARQPRLRRRDRPAAPRARHPGEGPGAGLVADRHRLLRRDHRPRPRARRQARVPPAPARMRPRHRGRPLLLQDPRRSDPRSISRRLHHPLRDLFPVDAHPPGSAPPVPPAVLRPLASFFSGAVGTLFGSMASIFFAMYLDASGANKQAFRATLSAMLMTLSVARTIGYAAVDELTLDSFILCAAALPAMGLGLLVGDRIHSGLSQTAFQRVVCAALFLCGVPLLLK